MKRLEADREAESIENYQSYKITQELTGRMTPTRDEIINYINSKRKDRENHEKVQNQKRQLIR